MIMQSTSRIRKQGGSALLVLAILMIVLGFAAAVVLALLPHRSDQERIDKTITTVEGSRDAILGFIVENYRLPVPDTDNDGLENAGAVSGALPYRSMELSASLLDEASMPLRYAPYRKTGLVDLAAAQALYAPALPDLSGLSALLIDDLATFDTPTINECAAEAVASPINLLDFCTALDNAITTPAAVSSVNVGPGSANVAYAVLSGGLEDADGNGLDQSLDGPNDDGDVSYEDPSRGRGAGYDDVVRGVRFSTLQRQLSCVELIDSVNLLASTAQSAKGVMESTISAYNSSEVQVIMAGVAVAMDAVAIAQTVQAGIGIPADIAKSGGGCASVLLSPVCCPALAGNIAAGVVYAVTVVVEIAKFITDAVALAEAVENRDLFLSHIIPGANAHLCTAIAETTAADARGGLAPVVQP